MATRTVAVRLIAEIGGYTSALSRAAAATRGLEDAAKKTNAGISDIGKGAALVGGAIAIGLGVAVKSALDFEKAMRNVNSLLGLNAEGFAQLNEQVLALGDRMPQSAQNLAEGLYEIASSGFDGAEGLEVLEAAAVAATAGITDTDTAAKGITAVLNAYGREASDAGDISDVLFSTVNYGVISFEELSHELGDFVGTAAAAKVPIEDAGAAIATMTLAGISGAESATSLNRVLQSLIDPSEALSGKLQELGYQSGAQALEADGLRGVMDRLRVATGGNITELLALFPEIRAARGALALMANEGQNYARVAGEMEDETARAGATQKTFEEQMKATANQAALVGGSLGVVGIQIGTLLLPAIGKLIEGFGTALTWGRDLADEVGERLAPFFAAAADVGVDLWQVLSDIGDVVVPVASGIGQIAGGAVIGALNLLGAALAAITGFLADNETLALSLAAVMGVQLLGGIGALTVAFNRLILTPVVLFASNLIGALGGLATIMSGGIVAAAGAARVALVGLMTAAAPLAMVAAVTALVVNLMDTSDAAADTRAEVDRLWDSVNNADDNGGRIAALAGNMATLRGEIATTRDQVESLGGAAFGVDDAFRNFFSWNAHGDWEDARTRLSELETGLDEMRLASARASEATAILADQFNLSEQDVQTLADQFGIDLTGGINESIRLFQNFNALKLEEEKEQALTDLGLVMAGLPASAETASNAFITVAQTAGMTAEQVEETIGIIQKWREETAKTLASFTDPLAVYQQQLQTKQQAERTAAEATAAATEDSSDSWEDYATDVSVSLGEYAAALEQQIRDQEAWRDNIVRVTQRGGTEIGQILLNMGPEAAGLVAQMANATDAEFNRAAEAWIADARFGSQGAAAELQQSMQVMAIIGRDGASATAQNIADQLGIGVDRVREIAAQYGVELAAGVNPVLTGLGRTPINYNQVRGQRSAGVQEFWSGGYTGDGGKREPKGIVHGGEYVVTKERTARLGVRNLENLERILPGYAGGGYVTASDVPRPPSTSPYSVPISTVADAVMAKAYGEVADWVTKNSSVLLPGTFGPGKASPGGKGGLGPVAAAAREFVMQTFGLTNIGGYSYRTIAGTKSLSDHATGHAIDVMIPNYKTPAGIAKGNEVANYFVANAKKWGVKYVIWRDQINSGSGWGSYRHPGGGTSDTLQHRDHDHISFYETGTDLVPSDRLAYLHAGEAVVPAQANPASREFTGQSFTPIVNVAAPDLEGLAITGQLEVMPDGLVHLVDGRISSKVREINRIRTARGVRG